jgi:hypothetical protein
VNKALIDTDIFPLELLRVGGGAFVVVFEGSAPMSHRWVLQFSRCELLTADYSQASIQTSMATKRV